MSVKEAIKTIYHEHKGRYGYRRITKELKKYGFTMTQRQLTV